MKTPTGCEKNLKDVTEMLLFLLLFCLSILELYFSACYRCTVNRFTFYSRWIHSLACLIVRVNFERITINYCSCKISCFLLIICYNKLYVTWTLLAEDKCTSLKSVRDRQIFIRQKNAPLCNKVWQKSTRRTFIHPSKGYSPCSPFIRPYWRVNHPFLRVNSNSFASVHP